MTNALYRQRKGKKNKLKDERLCSFSYDVDPSFQPFRPTLIIDPFFEACRPAFTIDPFLTQLSYEATRALNKLHYRSAKSTRRLYGSYDFLTDFADLTRFDILL